MFEVAELSVKKGRIGLCPIPGRWGGYPDDLNTVLAWRPTSVLTMTTELEIEAVGADTLPSDLARHGVDWHHLPVTDFGAPCSEICEKWSHLGKVIQLVLADGGRVLLHCYGGCGRSGMVALRILTEAGEDPDAALMRLRKVRPCAVETSAQMHWASDIAPLSAAAV